MYVYVLAGAQQWQVVIKINALHLLSLASHARASQIVQWSVSNVAADASHLRFAFNI